MLKEKFVKDPEDGMKQYRVVFAEGEGVAWSEEMTGDKERYLQLRDVEDWILL